MPRILRLGFLLTAVALAIAAPAHSGSEPLVLEALQRRLNVEKPDEDRVGALRSLGILELRSPDSRFGGLSGLLVSADGSTIEAVTDQGHWIRIGLGYDESGRLVAAQDARIAALTGENGKRLRGKEWQDAESLALLDDALLVAFEQRHRIWRYERSNGSLAARPLPLLQPAGLEQQPNNEGIEGLERLADGSLLAIGSKTAKPDHYPAWLLRDDAWQPLWYFRSAPYEPTGAALLPDGDVVVLERRFSLLGGLAVRLVRVPGSQIEPGATLRGEEIAVIRPPLTADNFEGIAARQGPDGETLLYVLSDDNFNLLQRNLLLLFELE